MRNTVAAHTPVPELIVALIVITVALMMTGCGPKKPAKSPTAPQPATAAEVQKIREAYFRAYPESRVGVVTAARPQDMLVSVGEVQGSDFAENQIVTFIDSDQRVLTTGVVVRLLSNSIHVRYAKPERGGREPRVGDIMVKTPVGSATL